MRPLVRLLVSAISPGLVFGLQPGVSADDSFRDSFDTPGVFEEASSMKQSSSPEWWLNSGGRFVREKGIGRTLSGILPAGDRWREVYSRSNPRDSDGGRRPQNLLRLVTRRRWLESAVSVELRIRDTHRTASPNRGGWSGVLLFSRYVDGENLYYAGLRHDGVATIKKKRGGEYVTLADRPVVVGRYDAKERPNLLPEDRWIGLRLETVTTEDGGVLLRLAVRGLEPAEPGWTTRVETVDDGREGGEAITEAGSVGIRSDFMDVEFDEFRVAPPR